MITIEAEFQYRTPLGLADCKRSYDIFRDFLDDEVVENAVAWCKKAWSMDSIQYPTITFIYQNNTPYGHSCSRVCDLYGSTFMVKWGKYGNTGEKTEDVKVNARLFRELYKECVGHYTEWKEGEVG